jgi:hypothetical protein
MSSEKRSKGEDKLPPPNAFLAVQVQSPEIHRRLVDVAGKILDYDASLAWALEPVVKSHITLLGLFLPTVLRIRDVYSGSECFPSRI